MEDEEYLAFVAYLDENKYPDDWTKMQKRSLRLRSSSYRVIDGVLFRVDQDQHDRRVAKVGEVDQILRNLHSNSVGGGHFGMNATVEKVSQRYWWKGFSSSARDFVKNCEICQRNNPSNKAPPSALHPIAVDSQVFSRWGIDLIGPLKETKNGNRYVIVAVEYLTKWPELGALPNKDGSGVAKFIENIVYRFGVMKAMIHDNGTEFCNAVNRDLYNSLGTKECIATPYHPETNGLTERFNQTLITQLRKITDGQDWDEHLQAIAFSYRVGQQASTKMSPFRLIYGVQARLPIELELPSGQPQLSPGSLCERFGDIREQAADAIAMAQAKQKARFDIKHQGPHFQVGDLVLLVNARNKTRKGGKLDAPTDGPFTIAECLGKGTYRLEGRSQKVKRKSPSSQEDAYCFSITLLLFSSCLLALRLSTRRRL